MRWVSWPRRPAQRMARARRGEAGSSGRGSAAPEVGSSALAWPRRGRCPKKAKNSKRQQSGVPQAASRPPCQCRKGLLSEGMARHSGGCWEGGAEGPALGIDQLHSFIHSFRRGRGVGAVRVLRSVAHRCWRWRWVGWTSWVGPESWRVVSDVARCSAAGRCGQVVLRWAPSCARLHTATARRGLGGAAGRPAGLPGAAGAGWAGRDRGKQA